MTPAQTARQNLETAKEALSNTDGIIKPIELNDMLKSTPDGVTNFSIAIIRDDGDGLASIVWGLNKQSLINVVLAEAGKAISESNLANEVKSKSSKKAEERNDVVRQNVKKRKPAPKRTSTGPSKARKAA